MRVFSYSVDGSFVYGGRKKTDLNQDANQSESTSSSTSVKKKKFGTRPETVLFIKDIVLGFLAIFFGH